MEQPLDGPRRGAASGTASSLVVLLHGYGADGHDLFGLSESLAQRLPNTAFAAPNAPRRCEQGGPGFQWFGLVGPDGRISVRVAGADAAAPLLVRYLQAELNRHALDSSRLALVGFSQGTMMSLHVGPVMRPAPAAIVGFSGLLAAPERLEPGGSGGPPVLLIHGTADPVVPFRAMDEAAMALRGAGMEVETLARPGLGHGIDELGLRAAAAFLAARLGEPPNHSGSSDGRHQD